MTSTEALLNEMSDHRAMLNIESQKIRWYISSQINSITRLDGHLSRKIDEMERFDIDKKITIARRNIDDLTSALDKVNRLKDDVDRHAYYYKIVLKGFKSGFKSSVPEGPFDLLKLRSDIAALKPVDISLYSD